MSIQPSSRTPFVWPIVLLALLAVVGGAVAWEFWFSPRLRTDETPANWSDNAAPPPAAAQIAKPPARSQAYVGSQICAECHRSQALTYTAHPMYRSWGHTPSADDIEAFDERTQFSVGYGLSYRIERRGDTIYHHELMTDSGGRLIYDQEVPIRFFIGSGTRGRSYAIDRSGLLFQSPISWYSRESRWELSPGYLPPHHQRFDRRVADQCVDCHAGRASPVLGADHRFAEPVVAEAAIGCERCHGPGREHANFHANYAEKPVSESIINPALLSSDRRDAVCNQCHLHGKQRIARYGRMFGDFRPGDRLEEVWTVIVASSGVGSDGRTKAVSQVEQMYGSACYQRSEGRLGCISCHDPHLATSHEEAAAHYRRRCLQCHADDDCQLPHAERTAGADGDSCIRCHMPRLTADDIPHASQTDHRIVRRPLVEQSAEVATCELAIFEEEHSSLPDWERRRARCLALLSSIQSGECSVNRLVEVERGLREVVSIAADDRRSWQGLAMAASLRHDLVSARERWWQVLEVCPDDEAALAALADVSRDLGDHQLALEYAERLLAIDSCHAYDQMRRALALAGLEKWSAAMEAAETALRQNPADTAARRWLIAICQRQGELATADRHTRILERIEENLAKPVSGD